MRTPTTARPLTVAQLIACVEFADAVDVVLIPPQMLRHSVGLKALTEELAEAWVYAGWTVHSDSSRLDSAGYSSIMWRTRSRK